MKLNIEHYKSTFSYEIKCCGKHCKVTKHKQHQCCMTIFVKCLKCNKRAKFSQFYQKPLQSDGFLPRTKEMTMYDFSVVKYR